MGNPTARLVGQIAGGVLIASLFLKWFSIDIDVAAGELPGGFKMPEVAASAWQAFSLADLLLAVIGGAAIAAAFVESEYAGRALMAAGALATAYILFRFVNPPIDELAFVDVGHKLGYFVGLAAAAGVTFAGFLEAREETGMDSVAEMMSAGQAYVAQQVNTHSDNPAQPAPPPAAPVHTQAQAPAEVDQAAAYAPAPVTPPPVSPPPVVPPPGQ